MLSRLRSTWSLTVASALLALLLAGCGSDEEKAAEHRERGLELFEDGDDAKAMLEFRNALRLEPQNADTLYHIGRINERQQNWLQAVGAYRALLKDTPDFIDAHVRLGQIGVRAGDLGLLDGSVKAIKAIDPDNLDGLVLEATVLLAKKDYERARALAEEINEQHPEREDVIAVLAGVMHGRGRPEEALAYIESQLERLPESRGLREIELAILSTMGRQEEADRVLRELVELAPKLPGYRVQLAQRNFSQGDSKGAERVLREAMEDEVGIDVVGPLLIDLVYETNGLQGVSAEADRFLARTPDAHWLRLRMAQYLARENRLDEAAEHLQAVVEESEVQAEVEDGKAGLARIRIERGESEQAAALLGDILATNPEHRGANFAKALMAFREGNNDEAVRSARIAMRRNPDWLPGLRLIANAHLRAGEIDLAVDAFSEIRERDPDDVEIASVLAGLLTRRGDIDAALKIWNEMIAIDLGSGRARAARAGIRIRQRNFNAAQEDIALLAELPEQAATAALLSGNLEISRDRPEQGREWFTRALELAPDAPQPLLGIVRAYIAEDDVDGAIAALEERTRAQPDDPIAFKLLGDLHLRAQDLAAAEAAYRRALEQRPGWSTVYAALGDGLIAAGAHQEAIGVLEEALAAEPDSLGFLLRIASAQELTGEFGDAIDTYDRVLAIQPENEVAANNFAALVADHRHDDPDALDRALALAQRFRTSDNPAFLDTLGWVHYRRGDPAVAVTFLERAVTLLPSLPELRFHLGMALYANARPRRASEELTAAVSAEREFVGKDLARTTLGKIEAERTALDPQNRDG